MKVANHRPTRLEFAFSASNATDAAKFPYHNSIPNAEISTRNLCLEALALFPA
jgi:hypothetical protein